LEAIITLEYNDRKTATAIADSVSPDNFKAPAGLKVETHLTATKVVTNIKLEGKTATLIATIDDLLESVSTAEKTLHIVRRK
jgi:hypothetical protein